MKTITMNERNKGSSQTDRGPLFFLPSFPDEEVETDINAV